MSRRKFGLDLGTNNIKIYNSQRKTFIIEKNMIAIKKKKEVVAMGDAAYELYEKVSENILIKSPIKQGVIADIDDMGKVFDGMLKKINCSSSMLRSNEFYLAVPSAITEVEKKAYFDLVNHSNFKTGKAYIVEKPIASVVGEGLDVTKANGTMIIDIGADTTEISIIVLGGIVLSRLLKVGGNTINQSIYNDVKYRYNVLIGMKTAEHLKIELGSAIPSMASEVEVYGRDLITGLPIYMKINADLIHGSIIETLKPIIDATKDLLERTPPELNKDILSTGIYLTGGSSNISNLDRLISNETRMKVNLSSHPTESVIKGLETIMNNYALKHLAVSMRDAAYD